MTFRAAIVIALLALMPVALAAGDAPADLSRTAALSQAKVLSFEPAGTPGRYVAHGGAHLITVAPHEAEIAVAGRMLQVSFANANAAAAIQPLEPLGTVTNYYIGNDARLWRLGVRNFQKLRVDDLYPGVAAVYYGNHRNLEFDFVVAPRADASAISLAFSGADKLSTAANGDLVAEVNGHSIGFLKPIAYQLVDGDKRPIDAGYVLADGKVQLRLGEYDHARELVIDPVVSYATYLGGSQGDMANGIAVDNTGNAYITGQTCSPTFPGSSASLVNCNAYVSKLNATGTSVAFTTVVGGNHSTSGNAITLDASGNIYIVGTTNSDTGLPSPVLGNGSAYHGGDSDAFIAVMGPDGSLQRTAYLGGSGADSGYGVAVDAQIPANVIAVGQTCYDGRGNFPAYSGFEEKIEFCVAYVTKLDNGLDVCTPTGRYPFPGTPSKGGVCYFSEYFGGQPPNVATTTWHANTQYVRGDVISVNYIKDGNLVSAAEKCMQTGTSGWAQPTWSTTQGSLTDDGTTTWQNTGPPGTLTFASTIARGAAVDPLGDIFLAGSSDSDYISCDFPCNNYSYWKGAGSWVLKVSSAGNWVYSTMLGVTKTDSANAIAVDTQGRAYIVGTSTGGIFMPPSITSFQSKQGGAQDAFIVRMSTAGTAMEYSSYLGGSGDDQGLGVAVDLNGAAYITGSTKSVNFPVVSPLVNPLSTPPNMPMGALTGSEDAFVAKITPSGSAVSFATYLGGAGADHGTAIAAHQNAKGDNDMYVAGITLSADFPTYPASNSANPPAQTVYGNNGDGFVAMILGASLPNAAVSPTALGFSPLTINTASAAQTVTFVNSGTTPITLTNINITGDFQQTNNCPSTSSLSANASCTVSVVFTPTATGTRSGTLTFTSNANNSPQSIALTGTGTSLSGGGGSGNPDFTVTGPTSAVAISSSTGGNFNVTVTPMNGFSNAVNLACSAPSPMTCAVNPTSVTLDGSKSSTSTVTVTVPSGSGGGTTPTRTGDMRHGRPLQTLLPFTLVGVALIGRRKRIWVFLLIVLLCLSIAMIGCGGGTKSSSSSSTSSFNGVTAGTYSMTVTGTYTGTNGTQTHTTTVTLQVQ